MGLFNGTAPVLDSTLPEVLTVSVSSVNSNIESLFEQIRKLKEEVKRTDLLRGRSESGTGRDVHRQSEAEFDITTLKPYPAMVAHWRDPPDLQQPERFMNMGEFVDYVYRVMPKLQAHLTAMQAKIVENAADLLGKVDKTLVERMFEKFQGVIGDIRGRVDELRNSVEQTATREEINEMLDELLSSISQEAQTSVGRVKCMACGRDIPQVAGAVTEQEAQRILGSPPNSMVFRGAGVSKVGVVYQTTDGFDSGIVETPRSFRPVKPISRGQKQVKPRSPRQ
jgi:hypothetical protein